MTFNYKITPASVTTVFQALNLPLVLRQTDRQADTHTHGRLVGEKGHIKAKEI